MLVAGATLASALNALSYAGITTVFCGAGSLNGLVQLRTVLLRC